MPFQKDVYSQNKADAQKVHFVFVKCKPHWEKMQTVHAELFFRKVNP